MGDSVRNGLAGGFFGAAIGAGIGYAISGPKGALAGTGAGAVSGAAMASLITYYDERREMDAIADLQARTRNLESVLNLYRLDMDAQATRIAGLKLKLDHLLDKDIERLRIIELLDRELSEATTTYNHLYELNIGTGNQIDAFEKAATHAFGSLHGVEESLSAMKEQNDAYLRNAEIAKQRIAELEGYLRMLHNNQPT